jgi:hypothetical protein
MRRYTAVALGLALWLCTPAWAGDPSRANASEERAAAAFEDFAREFMAKVHGQEQRERRKPRVAAGPGSALFTYRGYGEEFRTELRSTGQAAAPFVGLLHYTEHVYSCKDLEGGACTVASTVPVTEIFRYQGGRWAY